MHDLYGSAEVSEVAAELEALMAAELYGGDEAWVEDGRLVGMPAPAYEPRPDRGISGHRGWR